MAKTLLDALASPEISVRIDAIAAIAQEPAAARPQLAALVADQLAPVRARVWGMIAICQIKDDDRRLASSALVECLSAREPIVRRCAIESLGALKVDSAVAQIAEHLTDHEAIPEAWFEDTSTPSQAARRALEAIGTSEAVQRLATCPST